VDNKPGSFSFLPSPGDFLVLSFLRSSSSLTLSRSRTMLSRPCPPCIEFCSKSNLVSSYPLSFDLLSLFLAFFTVSLSFSSFSFLSRSLSLSPPTNQPQLVFLEPSDPSFFSLDFFSDFLSSGRLGMMDRLSTRFVCPGNGDGCETSSSNDWAGLIGEAWAACACRFVRVEEECFGGWCCCCGWLCVRDPESSG